MKKDAEAHADEDKKKRDMIDVKNTADTMIYTTEKMMKEVDEKKIVVTDEEKKKVTDALAALKEVKDKDDVDAIKKASEELTSVAQAVGMKMYQQEQEKTKQGPGTDGGNSGGATEGPIEGEVVDDKK
jgi:molecular chaperone DnaK